MLGNEGKGQKKRHMIVEEDTVGMMKKAKEMFVFLLHLEPEAFTAMPRPENHSGA